MIDMKAYESQAKLSIILAVCSALGCVAALAIIVKNFRMESFETFYNPNSGFGFFVLLGGVAAALVCGGVGFMMAFNSAGQRRNKKSKLSWIGFFLNAGLMAVALSAFTFFWLTKYNVG